MVIKKIKQELLAERKTRNFNFAISAIPLCKTDTKCVNAIFHKSFHGNILIGLNSCNLPVIAWRDIDGIVPIRAKIVKTSSFHSIIDELQPKCLYLNDGESLRPLSTLKCDSLQRYTDKNLLEILKDIQLGINKQHSNVESDITFNILDDSSRRSNSKSNNINGNDNDNDDNVDSFDGGCINTNIISNNPINTTAATISTKNIIDKPPTFRELQSMEPDITRREYKKFCKEFALLISIKTTNDQYTDDNDNNNVNIDQTSETTATATAQQQNCQRARRRRRRYGRGVNKTVNL
ncbi:LEF-3 [Mauternbach virus]|uniref:LEF-3 n=1 Tax=Mauternbach virus TaxID=2486603 RepID=A0A3G3E650_9VIRU|nr:LEF-3 [Mauternbach virus]AYP97946.1 LEF-3 [Mauternbach virus]